MNNKKVLLVEDDTALASVYRSRLELEGFTVDEVNNGEEALSKAVAFKPDLILLDAMMPKISGFDVLDILRNTPETSNVRVVMLTALSQAKDKERAQNLGADDYLVKSQVVIGDVVDRIKYHLGVDGNGNNNGSKDEGSNYNTTPANDAAMPDSSKDDDTTHAAM